MNVICLRHRIFLHACALAVASSTFLAGCGPGGGSSETAGIGGTGIGIGGTGIVVGKITGFGSVHVNGGTFEIDTSEFDVDGDTSANQSNLALGMVITLEVETENGVFTDNALKVVYDDEVEGPVAMVDPQVGTTKIVHVFGQSITIDETSTVFDGTSFENIGNEDDPGLLDVIEVSGFRTSATDIIATYVRFDEDLDPGNTEVELRGPIKNLAGTPPDETFMVDGTDISTNLSTEIEVPGGVLVEDLYVEVKGKIQADLSVVADKIEYEDEDLDDDVGDVSLQGVISGFTGIANDFFIDSQRVNASTAELEPSSLELANGLNVEVEGEVVSGTLIAEEVEVREGETELRSEISEVDTVDYEFFKVTFPVAAVLNEVTVRVDGQTLFEDDTGPLLTPPFSLDDLMEMDFVRVEGREISGNEVLATVVKRVGSENKLKLEGEVDDYDPGNTITILGIEYGLDVDTDYQPDPPDIMTGDLIELEDDDDPSPPDGIADEVEEE